MAYNTKLPPSNLSLKLLKSVNVVEVSRKLNLKFSFTSLFVSLLLYLEHLLPLLEASIVRNGELLMLVPGNEGGVYP